MASEMICEGCGITLQTESQDALGYIPKSALTRETLLCQRCFQLRHYGKNTPVELESDEFLDLISTISETDSLIVHLIDIFDVEGTFLKSLPRIVGNNPIVLVANKVDLLPKSMNKTKVTHWLYRKAREFGVSVESVFLISAKKMLYIDELAKELERLRNDKDVYVVGVTNVGKSTFINQFIERSIGVKDVITTSYFPGTTLGFIKITLSQNTALIDTPGIVNRQQMAHYVSQHDLKKITPKKEIKPRNYQLSSGQTLFIGGLARIDFVKGDKQPFVCYFANDVPIHRTKLENADQLYERHVGEMLSPPEQKSLQLLPPLQKQSYRIDDERTDIVFPGLGWITVIDGAATVNVYAVKNSGISLRESLI